FFFHVLATTEIYTLSLHDALPIFKCAVDHHHFIYFIFWINPKTFRCTFDRSRYVTQGPQLLFSFNIHFLWAARFSSKSVADCIRSEEHTSELQSRGHLVCRLLLEK